MRLGAWFQSASGGVADNVGVLTSVSLKVGRAGRSPMARGLILFLEAPECFVLDRLEGRPERLVDVAKDGAVAREMDREGEHRPLDTSRQKPPQPAEERHHGEAVAKIVELVDGDRDRAVRA